MSIFSPPKGTIKVLEVEYSMSDVFQRVKTFLAETSPAIIWDDRFGSSIGWTSLVLAKGNPRLLGLAYYASGHIELRLNDSTKWMSNSGPMSSLGQKEDNTPTGTLAHELGHLFEYSFEHKCGKDAADLLKEYQELQLSTAVTRYGSSDPSEDWAEAYRLFLLNPALLKKLSPKRYALMLKADKLFAAKTGFKHGTLRPKVNPSHAVGRFNQLHFSQQL